MEYESKSSPHSNWGIRNTTKRRVKGLGIETSFGEMQKTIILQSARILRKVLEMRGGLLSLANIARYKIV